MPQLEQRYFRRNEGSTDYATIPEVTLTGDFVIEFDFLTSLTSSQQIALSGDVANNYIGFNVTGGILTKLGSTYQYHTMPSDFRDGKWHKCSIGYASGSVAVSIDGSVLSTKAITFSTTPKLSVLLALSAAQHFNGILANLKIYDNGTLVRDYPLDDNSDILRNRATVLGGNLNTTADPLDSVLIGGPAFSFYDFAELTSGVRYLATCDIANYSGSGAVGFRSTLGMGSGSGSRTRSSNGRVEILFDATDSGVAEIFSQSSNQCTFSSISIRQADGYGTVINGNASDWGLFDRQVSGDWLGQELSDRASVSALPDTSSDGFYYWTLAPSIAGIAYRISARSAIETTPSTLGVGWSGASGVPANPPFRVTNGTTGVVGGDYAATSTAGNRLFYSDDSGVASFDNVSVKEVLKNA